MLNKNLSEIFESNYIIPVYQRKFSWGEREITQFLQDIYDSFQKEVNKKKENNSQSTVSINYFIGSLVVFKRKDSYFEVIDGQQRLTVITLISMILRKEAFKKPVLSYDSRPEVEKFLLSFRQNAENINNEHLESFFNAINYIKKAILNPEDQNNSITIEKLHASNGFSEYFHNKVILVRVEVPKDTDVASYFEIMNNRGKQLQKHEILKAQLIEKIYNDENKQTFFEKAWTACSQMDEYLQKLFNPDERKKLFSDTYDGFFDQKDTESFFVNDTIHLKKEKNNINNILLRSEVENNTSSNNENGIDYENDHSYTNKSIIDFPNFLMHIFKLSYNENYRKKEGRDIPLNEKDLLSVFHEIKNDIDPMEFIEKLIFYRVVFDRYIIKATKNEKLEDGFSWSLKKPQRDNDGGLVYINTYKSDIDQARIIKCLSMLEVTYRNSTYKNWLQEVLGVFQYKIVEKPYDDFIKSLDSIVCRMSDKHCNDVCKSENFYSEGTNTHHLLFNLIDYLYWIESKNKTNNIAYAESIIEFDFRYRNSIEHHRPQSRQEDSEQCIDSIGNLCLVNKSANSKMNNEEPYGKAITYYNAGKLPPKRKIMYDMTLKSQSNLKWGKNEIVEHYNHICDLLKKRGEILSI